MLLEFRVSNFRSIRDEQSLSLLASKDDAHERTHVSPAGTASRVLNTAAIYGPNAGGKSNFLKAVQFFSSMVATSATSIREGQGLNCPPFRLDPAFATQPSEFEITFLLGGIRHQYGFAATPSRVLEEWLLVYQKAKPQRWFHRRFNAAHDVDEYEFSTHLTGQRRVWQQATRANALFLSVAVNLNSEKLRPIAGWIAQKLAVITERPKVVPDWTLDLLSSDAGKQRVINLMAAADIGIVDFELEKQAGKQLSIKLDAGNAVSHSVQDHELISVKAVHQGKDGSRVSFDIADESLGTQQWLWLVGPMLDILQNGRVLFVDEIDSSLHTLLLRQIISMFNDPEVNTGGAQLVFTTHDTALMDADILRRDQFWFVEKDADQATRLYPLLDFSPRKNEALEKGYLMGRYGAVPFVSGFKP